jgi:hypothetical protein
MRVPGVVEASEFDSVAHGLLEETGGGPGDPFVLARCCGLRLCPRIGRSAELRGSRVYFDGTAASAEQRSQVAQCVARFALARQGFEPTETAARRVAAALTGVKPARLGLARDAVRLPA